MANRKEGYTRRKPWLISRYYHQMALLFRIPDVTDSDLGVETDYPDRLLAVIRSSTAKYCDSNYN
jgi:hypothetical protein